VSEVESTPTVLVVDDTPVNAELLEAMLVPRGYRVASATSGADALQRLEIERPDLILLDVVMPGMDGLEVCRRVRSDPHTRFLPIVMITASATSDKVRAIEAGADDFLSKPFDQAELLARVKSLVRLNRYHDTIEKQATELAEWNRTLDQRVQSQLEELERLGRLRRFLSPALADLIVSADGEPLLESHRRQIAVVCCQLPGFRALAETAAPEEVVALLREYHAAVGAVVFEYEATAGPLAGDRLTVYFNDPLPVDDPAAQAVAMALAMRDRIHALRNGWRRRGLDADLAVGIDLGYATLGTIGFEGKLEYGAVGPVLHVAASLCDEAGAGRILATPRIVSMLPDSVRTTSLGELALAGLVRTVETFEIVGSPAPNATRVPTAAEVSAGPLSAREREVVALIAQGYSNRQIADALVIAEGTAVRHVANILAKLNLRTRAQVAVWAVTHAQTSPAT
jgi:CheY-like chemotaxis protein/class 3 adenylate cyclase/DNA-binding CsgD family transcriptional regulator